MILRCGRRHASGAGFGAAHFLVRASPGQAFPVCNLHQDVFLDTDNCHAEELPKIVAQLIAYLELACTSVFKTESSELC